MARPVPNMPPAPLKHVFGLEVLLRNAVDLDNADVDEASIGPGVHHLQPPALCQFPPPTLCIRVTRSSLPIACRTTAPHQRRWRILERRKTKKISRCSEVENEGRLRAPRTPSSRRNCPQARRCGVCYKNPAGCRAPASVAMRVSSACSGLESASRSST